jgi:hypothetical protein
MGMDTAVKPLDKRSLVKYHEVMQQPTIQYSLRLPIDIAEAVREGALDQAVSQQQFIIGLLRDALNISFGATRDELVDER